MNAGSSTGPRIVDVIAHPLTQARDDVSKTSWVDQRPMSIVVVEVVTDAGIVGIGECLARFAPIAYAEAIRGLYKPMLVGEDPTAIAALSEKMRRALSGKPGGIASECIAGIDIALWDVLGKLANLPIYKLLGGNGRTDVPCYGGSVFWGNDHRIDEQLEGLTSFGFTSMKLKIGRSVADAIKRIELIRHKLGDAVELCVDANWDFSVDEAVIVGDALAANGYIWFEEPIPPEDVEGYKLLRSRTRVPLAAGESEYNLSQAAPLIASRAISFAQPNITRAGGITETRRIVDFAHAHHVAYAPHNGGSGIICEVATLHLAAAAPNLFKMECSVAKNAFKSELGSIGRACDRASNGLVAVPDGPGLGIELDRDAMARYAVPA